MAVNEGAGFDPDVLMNHVAGHPGGAGEHDFLCLDLAVNRSGQLDGIAVHGPFDLRAASNRHGPAPNIAIHLAVNAYVFRAFKLTGDLEGFADDRNAYLRWRGP